MASLLRLGGSLGGRLVRWLRGRVLTLGRRVGLSCLLRVLRLARGLCRGALVRRLTFLLGSRTLGCWLVLGLRSGILVLRLARRLRRRLLAGLTLWLWRWVLILRLARCRVSLRGDRRCRSRVVRFLRGGRHLHRSVLVCGGSQRRPRVTARRAAASHRLPIGSIRCKGSGQHTAGPDGQTEKV